jgi:hypothetical protein
MRFVGLALVAATLCSCNNILASLKETTDQSLLFDAETEVDAANYTGALATISKMSTSFQASRQVLDLKASAYAGRCGLNYVQLISQLSSIGNTRLFLFLLQKFDGAKSSAISDCEAAETTLESISTNVNLLTEDEALFLIFLSFAKIGVILAADADPNATGAPEASFNACSASSISDSDAGNVATGLSLALNALTAVGSLTTIGSSQVGTINTFCTDLQTTLPTYDFCGVTNAANLTATQLLGIRSLIQENQLVGLGTCNGNLASCVCP